MNDGRQEPSRDLTQCDPEALIAYLYDDVGDGREGSHSVRAEPDREWVVAHLAMCPACATELDGLRSTRTLLASWTPPAASLGFRVTDEDAAPARLNPAGAGSTGPEHATRPTVAWWRQPLPAWAQAAAAVLIFAAGMTFGGRAGDQSATVRESAGDASPATFASPVAAVPAVADPVVSSVPGAALARPGVTPQELARLDERLRALETTARERQAVRGGVPVSERELIARVETLITASEERQRNENLMLLDSVARQLETQRRVDLRTFNDRLGRIHDTTEQALRQQGNALSYMLNVSQTGATPRR